RSPRIPAHPARLDLPGRAVRPLNDRAGPADRGPLDRSAEDPGRGRPGLDAGAGRLLAAPGPDGGRQYPAPGVADLPQLVRPAPAVCTPALKRRAAPPRAGRPPPRPPAVARAPAAPPPGGVVARGAKGRVVARAPARHLAAPPPLGLVAAGVPLDRVVPPPADQ